MSTVNSNIILSDTVNTSNSTSVNIVSNTFSVGANVFIGQSTISVNIGNSVINSSSIGANSIQLRNPTNLTYYSYANTPLNTLVDYQVFTSNGTWIKPSWAQANDIVTVMLWGAGGGGGAMGGGGGGACVIVNISVGRCNAICNVVIGAGGNTLLTGENSYFWPNTSFSVVSYGGGGAGSPTNDATLTANSGGGGGGWFSTQQYYIINSDNTTRYAGGAPNGILATGAGNLTSFGGGSADIGGGGSGVVANGYGSVFGGGAGATNVGGAGSAAAAGGVSIYGGCGGSGSIAPVYTSNTFGGLGGNTTAAATAPGGGGGMTTTALYNTGARGEARIYVFSTRSF